MIYRIEFKIQGATGWNVSSKKSLVKVTKLVPVSVALLENSNLSDTIKLRWGHPGVGWALNPIWLGSRDTDTQQEDSHVQTEAEVGIMLTQVMELLRLPELEEARKDLPLKTLGRSWSSWHLDFELLAFRATEGINFYCLKPLKNVLICDSSPRKLIHMVSELEESV